MLNSNPTIVLKFGSSVLGDAADLDAVVAECYRYRRDGYQVIAVVSAFGETTDDLFQAALAHTPEPDEEALAELLATGEIASASWLTLALRNAGLTARSWMPGELNFVAEGSRLSGRPVDLEVDTLRSHLEAGEIAVVPGFFAKDREGQTILLGRGGSDLSAVFLADKFGAQRCRLIKDTDGVYESDPNVADANPRRFAQISFADALKLGAEVLQARALEFAEAADYSFEVAALHGEHFTRVGSPLTQLVGDKIRPAAKLNLLIAGGGVVGSALIKELAKYPDLFEILGVLVRDRHRTRDWGANPPLAFDQMEVFLARPADVVVELLGGEDLAPELIDQARQQGRAVVSANKAWFAREEAPVLDFKKIFASAAVGGALPVLECLGALSRRGESPLTIRGLLNGTSNFILNRLAEGEHFQATLLVAQERGFAESDPTRDLDGRDAEDKLKLIARLLGKEIVEKVAAVPINEATAARAIEAAKRGQRIRQVATLTILGDVATLEVELQEVGVGDPLYCAPGALNLVTIECASGLRERLGGLGAGGRPTAESVLGDLLQIHRDRHSIDCHDKETNCEEITA